MRTAYKLYFLIVFCLVAVALGAVLPKIANRLKAGSDEGPVIEPASSSQESKKMVTAKIADSKSGRVERAVFGAGCFWGVEAAFRRTPGVLQTEVGYAGGTVLNPTYEQVCTDTTGHAEVVAVEFDPAEVSFDQLLDVFFSNHNPTQLNFQGPDFGKQYRSVVFYADDAQKQAAEASKQKLAESGKFSKPVVTQIVPLVNYFPAEGYHQQYLEKRGLSHCHL
jgi:peptide-methionine (S)-S-oxide reductase